MKQLWQRIWSDDSGQGMVEYALIVGLVAVGLIAVFLFLRNSTGDVLNSSVAVGRGEAGWRSRTQVRLPGFSQRIEMK